MEILGRDEPDLAVCHDDQRVGGAQPTCRHVDPATAAVADLPSSLGGDVIRRPCNRHVTERGGGVPTVRRLVVSGVGVIAAEQHVQRRRSTVLILTGDRNTLRATGCHGPIIDRIYIDSRRGRGGEGCGPTVTCIAKVIDCDRDGVRVSGSVGMEVGIGCVGQTVQRGVDLALGAGDGQVGRAITRKRGAGPARCCHGAVIDRDGRFHVSAEVVGIADGERIAVPGREGQAGILVDRLVGQAVHRRPVVGGRHIDVECVGDGIVAVHTDTFRTVAVARAGRIPVVGGDRDENGLVHVGNVRSIVHAV